MKNISQIPDRFLDCIAAIYKIVNFARRKSARFHKYRKR